MSPIQFLFYLLHAAYAGDVGLMIQQILLLSYMLLFLYLALYKNKAAALQLQ